MQKQILEFIAALRASGVRISVAESEDAFAALDVVGMLDQATFQDALRTTLVKTSADEATFDELFPVYFHPNPTPMVNLNDILTPQERQQLRQATRGLLDQLQSKEADYRERFQLPTTPLDRRPEDVSQTLSWLLNGQPPDEATLAQLTAEIRQEVGPSASDSRVQRLLLTRLGLQHLSNLETELQQTLQQQQIDPHTRQQLTAGLQTNRAALADQVARQTQRQTARQWAEQQAARTHQANQLMTQQLQTLSERETHLLRAQVRRLVAQVRSRIALRRKRALRHQLDVRRTMRQAMRYGGVPLRLHYKTQPRKPQMVLLCDISNSMRQVVEFALRLVYELQDQASRVRTFTFIDTLDEISDVFAQHPPEVALSYASTRLRPEHPNTDFGHCLGILLRDYSDVVDRRTTVIVVGDACNSWNNPRLDLMRQLQRQSKAVVWLNPRPRHLWEANDCDMPKYLPYVTTVQQVGTLAELAQAIDALF